jgi:hypothetical protein
MGGQNKIIAYQILESGFVDDTIGTDNAFFIIL